MLTSRGLVLVGTRIKVTSLLQVVKALVDYWEHQKSLPALKEQLRGSKTPRSKHVSRILATHYKRTAALRAAENTDRGPKKVPQLQQVTPDQMLELCSYALRKGGKYPARRVDYSRLGVEVRLTAALGRQGMSRGNDLEQFLRKQTLVLLVLHVCSSTVQLQY